MDIRRPVGHLTRVMILGVILGLSLVVLSEFKSTPAVFNDSTDANTTIGDVINVFGDVVDWLPIVVIVVMYWAITHYTSNNRDNPGTFGIRIWEETLRPTAAR